MNRINVFLLLIIVLLGVCQLGWVNKTTTVDLKEFDWNSLNKQEARETLARHIDAAKVPHGDLSISSDLVHSKRYIISQWQRVATGAVVIVLSRDKTGELVIALGEQRGSLVPPQGYMESQLPKEDLTGLREQGASRINGSNGKIVKADHDLEENAVREVKEELGLDIDRDKLVLIGISSLKNANPIVHTVAAQYAIMLDKPTDLKVIDDEFVEDDMQSPQWFKVKDIKCSSKGCFVKGSVLTIREDNIASIQKAIKYFSRAPDLIKYSNLMGDQ